MVLMVIIAIQRRPFLIRIINWSCCVYVSTVQSLWADCTASVESSVKYAMLCLTCLRCVLHESYKNWLVILSVRNKYVMLYLTCLTCISYAHASYTYWLVLQYSSYIRLTSTDLSYYVCVTPCPTFRYQVIRGQQQVNMWISVHYTPCKGISKVFEKIDQKNYLSVQLHSRAIPLAFVSYSESHLPLSSN